MTQPFEPIFHFIIALKDFNIFSYNLFKDIKISLRARNFMNQFYGTQFKKPSPKPLKGVKLHQVEMIELLLPHIDRFVIF